MEGELLKILQQAKEARLAATLTFTTSGGKIKAKLEVELEPTAPSPTGPTPSTATSPIVVTTGIEPSSNIGNALMSAMYGRSSELGLYLWGNPPLPTVQGLPPPVGCG